MVNFQKISNIKKRRFLSSPFENNLTLFWIQRDKINKNTWNKSLFSLSTSLCRQKWSLYISKTYNSGFPLSTGFLPFSKNQIYVQFLSISWVLLRRRAAPHSQITPWKGREVLLFSKKSIYKGRKKREKEKE